MRRLLIGLCLLALARPASADPAAYTAAMDEGERAMKAHNPALAVVAFDKAVAADPMNATPLSELSVAALGAGLVDKAREAALKATICCNAPPNLKAAAFFNLGRAAEKAGDRAAARDAYEQSLKLRDNAVVRAAFRDLGGKPEVPGPADFEKTATARAAELGEKVVDWWSDDLDGDGKPEAIAYMCNDAKGLYVVRHGAALLEMTREIDGRNSCYAPDRSPPPWHEEQSGGIAVLTSYHRGGTEDRYGVRGGALADLWSQSESVECHGENDCETFTTTDDYEKLTYVNQTVTRKRTTSDEGILLPGRPAAAPVSPRPARLGKGVTLSARMGDHAIEALHITATEPFKLAWCRDKCGKSFAVAANPTGFDLPVPEGIELVPGERPVVLVTVGGKKFSGQLLPVGESGYPEESASP